VFELKPTKREVKSQFQQFKSSIQTSKTQMSSQINNNNNYITTPTSSNPYISRKLNNMDEAQIMKKEREDLERLYNKTLKRLEMIIDVQRVVNNMKKIAEEANMTITEIESTILMVSINNRMTNAMNIAEISEDL